MRALSGRPWLQIASVALTVVLVCLLGLVATGSSVALAAGPDADGLPIRQATPDLTVSKTNNVAGQTTVGSTWAWTFAIRNQGSASATFTAGQAVLLDNLPTPNVLYPSVTPSSFGAATGTLGCTVDAQFTLTCVASGGNVTIPVGSGFDVVLQATSSVPGTYADPRAGGVCRVDPSAVVSEGNESNNDCADTVVVVGADLTVSKTNNVSGTAALGAPWIWTIAVRNDGVTPANLTAGQRLLLDALPNSGVSYANVAVTPINGAPASVACAIDGQANLTCQIVGADLTLLPGTGYTVTFQATASLPGVAANPRAGGVCAADPDGVQPENSEANNACADSVTVPGADLTATKTNNVGGTAVVSTPWVWRVVIANAAGGATATIPDGQRLLIDNLPNANVSYGSPVVTPSGGATGTVNCTIGAAFALTCTASGPVTIPVGGAFDVAFSAVSATVGSYRNPRGDGLCVVDPENVVPETSEVNNGCLDTVAVVAASPDLRVVKTNSAGGTVTVGAPFAWQLAVSNGGTANASFASGQTVLVDSLPAASFTYAAPNVTNVTGVSGGGTVVCSIAASILTCTATGPVTIAPAGGFQVAVVATPGSVGRYVNPRPGGSCAVDPNNVVAEGIEANNSCTDTVTVVAQLVAANDPNNDDEARPLTETQRHQRDHSNASGLDDYRTEGNVLEVRCDAGAPPEYEVAFPDHTPYLVIATRDGNQQVRLIKKDARDQCQSARVGDYAEAEGEKQHEFLFDAHDLTLKRRR